MLGLIARMRLWQQLGMNLKSGMTIEDSLKQIAGGRGSASRLAASLAASGGASLGEAIAAAGIKVSELERTVVEAGEQTGTLPETCSRLVEFLRDRRDFYGHLLLRAAYPVIIIHLAALAGPFARQMISSSASVVTIFGAALIALSPFYAVVLLLFVLPSFVRARSAAAALMIDRFLLSLPIVGRLCRQDAEVEFFWLAGTMLEAGIDIRETVDFASRRISNYALREELVKAAGVVNAGEPLSDALRQVSVFYRDSVSRIETAEVSGNLAAVFNDLYQEARDVKRRTGYGIAGLFFLVCILLAGAYVLWAALGAFHSIFRHL